MVCIVVRVIVRGWGWARIGVILGIYRDSKVLFELFRFLGVDGVVDRVMVEVSFCFIY